jgi:DNA-binding MarR family transcriptional regulator
LDAIWQAPDRVRKENLMNSEEGVGVGAGPASADARSDTHRATAPEADAPFDNWLGETEQEAWRSFLYGVNLLLERFNADLQRDPDLNLSLDEYEILVRLSATEGNRMRMSDLAEKVVHSRSRLTHTVARLEKRGIVERVRSTCDGRGREAHLTAFGMGLLERAAPVHVTSVRRYLVDVIGTEDLLELGRIMGRTIPRTCEEAAELVPDTSACDS